LIYTTNQDFYVGEAQSKFDDKNIMIIGDMNALNASERDEKAKLDRYGLTDLVGEDNFFATVQDLANGYEQKAVTDNA
jgi:hypothetical protein